MMTKRDQTTLTLFAVIMIASAIAGFIDWRLFVLVAGAGSYAMTRMQTTRWPAFLAATATALGWLAIALARDISEGGRVSVKLATFLHLPHAVITYIVLFLICFIPGLFAAVSGKALAEMLTNQRDA